VLFRSHWQRD